MINYKKAFEKLVEQIELETKWAEEEYHKEHPEGLNIPTQKSTKGCTVNQFWIEMSMFGRERYDKGMMTAYNSMRRLAEKLKDGTFFEKVELTETDGYEDQTDAQYEHDVVKDMFI